jgi:hypothetical protein
MRRFVIMLSAVALTATPVLAAAPSPGASPKGAATVHTSATPVKGAQSTTKKPQKIASAARSHTRRHHQAAAPKAVTPASVTK